MKENEMFHLSLRFHPDIRIAILWSFCGVFLIVLGISSYVLSHSASTKVEPTLTHAMPTLTQAGYTSTPPKTYHDDTLTVLENNQVPAGDWRDEAIRLKGILDIPEVVSTTPSSYAIGDITDFL
jgi:hypothetical protein